jgi:hypothetical protein
VKPTWSCRIEHGFECDAIGVEVYTGKHYVTITGQMFEGGPGIGPAPRTIARLRAAVDAAKAKREPVKADGGAALRGSLEDAGCFADALRAIPSDGRDIWLRVGMALKSELGDAGFAPWCSWAKSSEKWNEADSERVWRSIKPEGGITIGTLFDLAQGHGWTPKRGDAAEFAMLPDL